MTVYTHSSSDQNPNSSSSSHFNQIKSSNQTISPIQPQISMKPVSLSSNNPQAQNLTLYSPVRRLISDRILKEKKKKGWEQFCPWLVTRLMGSPPSTLDQHLLALIWLRWRPPTSSWVRERKLGGATWIFSF